MSVALHGKTLYVEATTSIEATAASFKALASAPRWRILAYLAGDSRSVNEIAEALSLPASTVAAHIKILEEAGFIHTELLPAAHGLQKVCSRTYDNMLVALPTAPQSARSVAEVVMPIGGYTSFDVRPTCGLAGPRSLIGYLDDPLSFYEPDRTNAGLIWFRSGYVEYVFPNRLPASANLLMLQLSMEICSEAPLHHVNWPSDVTLWINGHEIGTWTCPSDFGGQRGTLTPAWWDEKDSQYGLLKRWMINDDGSFIDGWRISDLTVADLGIESQRVITVRLGVKPDALHMGGLNLFGSTFGNYPQDLVLRLEYAPGQRMVQEESHNSLVSVGA